LLASSQCQDASHLRRSRSSLSALASLNFELEKFSGHEFRKNTGDIIIFTLRIEVTLSFIQTVHEVYNCIGDKNDNEYTPMLVKIFSITC